MSGPVREWDARDCRDVLGEVEVREGRPAEVGGMGIVRVLPTKRRRTVGAWCFTDLMLPGDELEPDPMEVGPHPHIGLATVTWLLDGEAVHTDSLGTEQAIRPGQLNLMTAGHGIAHAELGAPEPLRGVQLWIAQPEETRHGANAFEHHAELPQFEVAGATGSVLLGTLAGATSTARADTPLVGAQVSLRPGQTMLPIDPGFEHAVVPLDNRVKVGEDVVEHGWLAAVPPGPDALPLEANDVGATVLLLGGMPMDDPVVMWWNFVARDRDEITAAWRDWQAHDDDRFGPVPSGLERIDAPAPPWVRSD
ncbi:MAG TPA: pirin family protein [Nitriliruptoraceae bacterium]|nr:pirin family protein [Nitriliruptoraceae bacterium]